MCEMRWLKQQIYFVVDEADNVVVLSNNQTKPHMFQVLSTNFDLPSNFLLSFLNLIKP